jgi:hypothetical protein
MSEALRVLLTHLLGLERIMIWVIGTIVVVLALVAISRRRNRRDPSYDETTRGRVDDHEIQRGGDNMHDRFGGGQI